MPVLRVATISREKFHQKNEGMPQLNLTAVWAWYTLRNTWSAGEREAVGSRSVAGLCLIKV